MSNSQSNGANTNKRITWRCEKCHALNEIIVAFENLHRGPWKDTERGYLELAVCSSCRKPRNPQTHLRYLYAWRCPHCGLPEPFVRRKGRLCQAAWMRNYWEKKKVIAESDVVELPHASEHTG